MKLPIEDESCHNIALHVRHAMLVRRLFGTSRQAPRWKVGPWLAMAARILVLESPRT